jgi:hypothetical protein
LLFFDPKLVQAVLELASRLPRDMDTFERYRELSNLVFDSAVPDANWQKIFSDP